MMYYRQVHHILLIICAILLVGCQKKKFLDEKPSTNIIVPTTLADFRKLLDNDVVMRLTPNLGEVSADDYYIPVDYWHTLQPKEKNGYTWAADIYEGQEKIEDWNVPYNQVFYANVVLDGLEKLPMTAENEREWRTIKGTALFVRSYAFNNIAQLFAPVYDASTASTDLGIPLRLHSEIETKSVRSTVKQTYDQIVTDLYSACRLLPDSLEFLNRNRPSKPTAFAMLSRVFLTMRDYGQAGAYADSCLRYYNKLIDYDTVARAAFLPFSPLNRETLYQSRLLTATQLFKGAATPDCVVDSFLYRSYHVNDLRREVIFEMNSDGLPITKGNYTGTIYGFTGLATDEIFLIRAECYGRAGKTAAALQDLNTLLKCRWRKNTFVPFTAATADEALQLILKERRKELLFRGLRWSDIRRLNKEGAQIKLTRRLNEQPIELPAGDKRFVLPIPPDVIRLTGMPQNPR